MTEFIGIPNGIVLSAVFLAGLLLSIVTLRIIYIKSEDTREYHTFDLTLVVRGGKYFSVLMAFNFILDFLLMARVPFGFVNGESASIDAVTQSYWPVIRLFFAFLMTLLAYLYDSHFIFRWVAIIALPLMIVVDAVSEVSCVDGWYCIEESVCAYDSFLKSLYFWMTWRDICGCIVKLVSFMLAVWLFFLSGFFRNEIYNPRREHRDMTLKLDSMRLGAKKIIRKKVVAP